MANRSVPPEVKCQMVSKTFGEGVTAVSAVAPTNITFKSGTTTALVGPSGCGKSTLLRMIAGLESASQGAIMHDDDTPDQMKKRGEIAVAFQEASLLPWRTVTRNVMLARRLAGLAPNPDLVQELIEMVGLSGFENKRPAELSGGMRQRAAIARCMASEPRLLLLDEPFGAVDELTRKRLNVELPPVWERRGATCILVTHSVAEAVLLCDRVIALSHRPASIIGDVEVKLERPRTKDMIDSDEFRDAVSEIEAILAAQHELGHESAA